VTRGPDVAIVGAGLMGGWHARYAAAAGAKIAAIVDRQTPAAARLARSFPGAAVFGDLAECLRRTSLEAVHVCSSTDAHPSHVDAALSAGKHVLVEKPLASSAGDVERLLDEARSRGRILAAVHQFPFQRGARRLRRDVERLGELVRCEFVLCSAGGRGLDEEGRRRMLLEMLPHPVSLVRSLFGRAGAADPEWQTRRFTPDELELTADGGAASFEVFLSLRGRPTRCDLAATGTRATASLDLFHGFCWIDAAEPSRVAKAAAPFRRGTKLLSTAAGNLARRALVSQPAYPGLPELIGAFYRAVAERGKSPVSREEILACARLADRLKQGIENRGSRAGS